MRFRPCIDIHNGQVKQIVGGSLLDTGNVAKENYVASEDGAYFAELYKRYGLKGGHIILLNPADSEYYEKDVYQARLALNAYKGGLQIGGGINARNAEEFIKLGASHVIVTSYVFKNGEINMNNLRDMVSAVGREHLVLDLSCRWHEDAYYIVTDRWQKFTNVKMDFDTLSMLSESCDEYLIHAVDVEGKASGIEANIATMLGEWGKIPMTYAGGVSSFRDLDILRKCGRNKLDVTIGSALDIFGGNMKFQDVIKYMEEDYEEI